MLELMGFAGISLSLLAYAPQVIHLAREHCSAGISPRAWALWLLSSALVGLVALNRGDPVFIALQASSLIAAGVIFLLARRYRGLACETHARLPSPNA